eukprot:2398308-Pleurochrysis_carterae.AAC.1
MHHTRYDQKQRRDRTVDARTICTNNAQTKDAVVRCFHHVNVVMVQLHDRLSLAVHRTTALTVDRQKSKCAKK